MWIKEKSIWEKSYKKTGNTPNKLIAVLPYCIMVAISFFSAQVYAQTTTTSDTVTVRIRATDTTAINKANQKIYNVYQSKMSGKFSSTLFSLITRKPSIDTLIYSGIAVDEAYRPYKDKIINNIEIVVLSPFGYDVERYDTISDINWLEKIGNGAHSNTRRWVIRNNLLFKKGQAIDPYLMAATGAYLRGLEYVNDVHIAIDTVYGDYADVTVIVQDNFSSGFYIRNLSSKTDVELYEQNMLGLGNHVSLRGIMNTRLDKKFGFGAGYKYNNFLKTFINLDISYVNHIETENFRYAIERPLQRNINYFGQFSFQKATTNLKYTGWDSISPTYNANFSASLGYAFKPFKDRNTFVIAARYLNRTPQYPNVVKPTPEADNYMYVKNQMTLLQLSLFQQRYYRNYLVNSLGKSEDFAYGYNVSAQVGYSEWKQFNKNGLYTSLKASANRRTKLGSFYFEGAISSFFDKNKPFEGVINLKMDMFSPLFSMGNHHYRHFFNVDYTKRLNFLPNFRNYNLTFGEIASMNFNDLEIKSSATQRLMFKTEGDFFGTFTVLGFRFLLCSFIDFGWIADYNQTLLNRHNIYWGAGAGVRIRNDLLVFRTLELKLGWYPRLNQSGFTNFVNTNSSIPNISPDFRPKYPEEIPLGRRR